MQMHVIKEMVVTAMYIHVCLCSCMATQCYLEISGWYICRYGCIYTPTHTYSHTLAFLSVHIHVNRLYLCCAQSDFICVLSPILIHTEHSYTTILISRRCSGLWVSLKDTLTYAMQGRMDGTVTQIVKCIYTG